MSVTIVLSKEMTMFAYVLDVIFWSYIKTAVCISAFFLPLALLMITRRISKKAEHPIRTRVLVVTNVLLALSYGGLLLSRQMDTLLATAFVGYTVALVYALVMWLISAVRQTWRKLFDRSQVQESVDRINTSLPVS